MDVVGWAIGIAGIIIGIAVAAVFYIRSRRTRDPLWSIKTVNLIRNYKKKLPDLDISYRGKPGENISISRVLFWNGGPDAIRRKDIEDVPETDRLRIEPAAEGVRLLDITIIERNCQANQLSASQPGDQSVSMIDFVFLNRGQGGVFQVVHTGVGDKDVRFAGQIVGAGIPRRARIRFPAYPRPKTFPQRLIALISWLFPSGAIIGLFALAVSVIATLDAGKPSWILLACAVAILVVYPLAVLLLFRRTPEGLRSFEDAI